MKSLPKIDLAVRPYHRNSRTEKLLALTREDTPRFFKTAEVVGVWGWIKFGQKQPWTITRCHAQLLS